MIYINLLLTHYKWRLRFVGNGPINIHLTSGLNLIPPIALTPASHYLYITIQRIVYLTHIKLVNSYTMKTNNIFRLLTLAVAAMAFAFVTSCEGPAGPAGPAGADGQDGANGAPGQDINETCKQCHNEGTDVLNTAQQQFGESGHAIGTYYDRSGQCAGCHNTEGFLSRVGLTGSAEWAAVSGTSALTQISCYTCHNVHATYTLDDWGLTNTAQVVSLFGQASDTDGHESYTMTDFSATDNSNLCLACHQSRDRGGVPTPTSTEDVEITSSHWGPHYGIQGQILLNYNHAGPGTGYATEGTVGHLGQTCMSCHMVNGDHSLAINYDNCATTCHGGAGDGDAVEAAQEALYTEIKTDLFALGAYLTTQGAMSENLEDNVIVGYSPVRGYMASAAEARGVWNYMTVYQDHSYGVHNPSYIRKLLENTKAELGY